jgi:hypothetical protein
MRITFTLPDVKPNAEEFARWAETEGVGIDTRFSSQVKIICNKRNLRWITAYSGYTYWWLPRSGEWFYEGAERGFLQQELLPPPLKAAIENGTVKIVHVQGTYGSFDGEQALKQYQEVKRSWERGTSSVYQAFETFGFFNHNGWEESTWTQHIYKMAEDPGYWLELEEHEYEECSRLSKTEIVKRSLARLHDDLRKHVFGHPRIEALQFATLVYYMRTIGQRGQSASFESTSI